MRNNGLLKKVFGGVSIVNHHLNSDTGGRRGKWKLLVPLIQLRHLLQSCHPVYRCRRHPLKPCHQRPRVSPMMIYFS